MKGPFIKSKNSVQKMMNRVLLALLPIIIFGFYKNGILPYLNGQTDLSGMLKPLLFIILGPTFTYFVERFYAKYVLKKKNEELEKYIKNSFSILPGAFLSLILPITTPIWMLLFGSIITVILGKMVYGGFGKNKFNPALVGKLFIIILSLILLQFKVLEIKPLETPLSNSSTLKTIGTYETLVSPYGTLKDFLFGFIPGTIGETAPILCIIAYIYLCHKKVIKKKIPILYVSTVFILTWVIGSINDLDIWYPLFQVLSGGLLFGAVFMATDPVTSPVTPIGQLVYSLCLGILTVTFRYLIPISEGILSSILIMNLAVPLLDSFGSKARARIGYYGIIFIIVILGGIMLSILIGQKYKMNVELKQQTMYIEKLI